MSKIFVGGGQFRRSAFRKLEEWESCKRALLVEIDPVTNSSHNCIEYESPKEVTPDELPAIVFKSPTLRGNKLYACTSTEVMIYDLPSFHLSTYISLPFFNDVHHVYPTPQGTVLVMVTGLDIVAEVSLDGKFLQHWDVMGGDTWSIFSRNADYRKIPTTKPHRAHANHIFQLGDEIFATRFHQRDAISLHDPRRKIEIGIQGPHDGFLFDGSLYFTTVDGHVVIANPQTLKIERGNSDDSLPVCASTYDYEGDTEIDAPYDGEILCIETDGLASTVWRFAHNRAIWVSPWFNTQPLGNMTPNGRNFLFTSGWDGQLGSDEYGVPRSDVWIVRLD